MTAEMSYDQILDCQHVYYDWCANNIMSEFGVSRKCAEAIYYLRTRYHEPEELQELIDLDKGVITSFKKAC